MRILFIQPFVAPEKGGSQFNTARLALGMARLGHDVALLGGFHKLLSLKPELDGEAVTIINYDLYRRGLWALPTLAMHIRRLNPDIVHSSLRSGDALASIASLPFRSKAISTVGEQLPTVHDLQNPSRLKTLLHKWALANRMDALVATSEYVKDNLLKYTSIGDQKIHVIPNGVDTKFFSPSRRTSASKLFGFSLRRRQVIATVGRISPEKRPWMLLDVVDHLNRRGLPVVGVFIGDGVQRQEVEDLVRIRGLSDVIKFANVRNDMNHVYRAIDVVVHFCDVEGFGLVHAEAMSSGTPVVAALGGAISDMITDGESGFLIAEADPKLYADRIFELLSDASLKEKIRNSGLNVVRQNFSLDQFISRHEKLYASVIRAK